MARVAVTFACLLLCAAVDAAEVARGDLAAYPYDDGVLVRVGLRTDLAELALPCCLEDGVMVVGTTREALHGSLRVQPGAVGGKQVFRVQVAALKDEAQAVALAERADELTGVSSDTVFDIASSFYRVRIGRFESRELAESQRDLFAERGLTGGWVVTEGAAFERPLLRLTLANEQRVVEGRWIGLEARRGEQVRLGSGSFRGRILIYLNDRGLLNLINEVPLEDYLRGVVPLEMGPELYRNLESLKAQAVAARTFAMHNAGGFFAEGYDICASPRCQVYGGADVEHPLSDRAIAATAGEVVIHEGQIAEALYSASCGGFTENVETVFPHKRARYLRGVPCPEAGATSLRGAVAEGTPMAAGVMRALIPQTGGGGPAEYEGRLKEVARLASLPVPRDSLSSLDRDEVRRYLASLFDLVLDARLLRAQAAPSNVQWSSVERRLHQRFARGEGALNRPMTDTQLEEVLLDLTRLLGLTREELAYFLHLGSGGLEVRARGEKRLLSLTPQLGTFRLRDGRFVAGSLKLAAGDRLRLVWSADRLLGVAQERSVAALAPGKTAWRRFRSDRDLGRSLQVVYPGFALADLEVVSRGVSGRVGQLRLHDASGETVLVEGLAVRWTLDTPDTWFDLRRGTQDGHSGWVFDGRGRGHGVGMCQLGAFAMGQRGHTYREILAHYYTGAKLGRLSG